MHVRAVAVCPKPKTDQILVIPRLQSSCDYPARLSPILGFWVLTMQLSQKPNQLLGNWAFVGWQPCLRLCLPNPGEPCLGAKHPPTSVLS